MAMSDFGTEVLEERRRRSEVVEATCLCGGDVLLDGPCHKGRIQTKDAMTAAARWGTRWTIDEAVGSSYKWVTKIAMSARKLICVRSAHLWRVPDTDSLHGLRMGMV